MSRADLASTRIDPQSLAKVDFDQDTALEILRPAAVPADGEIDAFGGRDEPRDLLVSGARFLKDGEELSVRVDFDESPDIGVGEKRAVVRETQFSSYFWSLGASAAARAARLRPGRPLAGCAVFKRAEPGRREQHARAGGADQTYSEFVSSGTVYSSILRYYVLLLVVQLSSALREGEGIEGRDEKDDASSQCVYVAALLVSGMTRITSRVRMRYTSKKGENPPNQMFWHAATFGQQSDFQGSLVCGPSI